MNKPSYNELLDALKKLLLETAAAKVAGLVDAKTFEEAQSIVKRAS